MRQRVEHCDNRAWSNVPGMLFPAAGEMQWSTAPLNRHIPEHQGYGLSNEAGHVLIEHMLKACLTGCSEVGGPNPEALATIAQVVAQMSAAAERSARAKRHKIAKVGTRLRPPRRSKGGPYCAWSSAQSGAEACLPGVWRVHRQPDVSTQRLCR
jgi:hypothetical protein